MKFKRTFKALLLSTAFLSTTLLASCTENNKTSETTNEKVILTIKYVSGNTTIKTEEKEIEKNKEFNLSSTSLDNYNFIGFYLDSTFENKISSITPEENTTIYAKYEEIKTKDLNSFSSKTNLDFTFTIDLANYTKPENSEEYDKSKTSTLFSFSSIDKLNNETHTSSFSNTKEKNIDEQTINIDSSELAVETLVSNENTSIELNFIYNFETKVITIIYNTTNKIDSTNYKYDYNINFYDVNSNSGSSENIYTLDSATQTYKRGTIHSDSSSYSITSASTLSSNSLIMFEENDQIKFNFLISTNIEL